MGSEDIDMTDMSTAFEDVFMSDPGDRPFMIGDLLKWTYALSLQPIMHEVAQTHCNGYYYDHLSQLKHDVCLLMSFEEQVETWFEEALQAVDEDQLIGSWISKLGGIHPAVQYH